MNCGAKPKVGTSFCPGCGAPTTPITEVCVNCGARVAKAIDGKTWKPTAAGILGIIAGVTGVIIGMVLASLGIAGGGILAVFGLPALGGMIAGAAAIPLILGIVAIVGSIYSLMRRHWGLALAGSICSLFCVWFLGIPAIIFVILGKGEFK